VTLQDTLAAPLGSGIRHGGRIVIRHVNLLALAVALAVVACVAGSVLVPPKDSITAGPKSDLRIGQKTGYFNLARVLRESERARTQVSRLNEKRERMAANLIGLRAMYADLQRLLQTTTDPNRKHVLTGDLVKITRLIEDTDRMCNKVLTEQAGAVVIELYKDLRATTAELARDRSLDAILGYPGNPGTEVPMEMELMLKAPAAQPFFVDPALECTDEIIRRLNEKFAAEEGDE
jgi:Skp family chaperone for outer membrane proteins